MPDAATAALALALAGTAVPATHATSTYHVRPVDGVEVFYREAGPRDAPTLLLLHGFPSSSRQFDSLIPLLADRWHVVAPDYPGFGLSAAPPPNEFAYTFDHLADVIDKLTETLGLHRYALYMNDYGGPVGFRLAARHPERIAAMIVQNAVAHEDGLGPLWVARKAFWADRAAHEAKVIAAFTSLEVARDRHVGKSPRPERYDPSAWIEEARHLGEPGQREIQADLFYDYRTNVDAYPRWQAWLKAHRPPMLVLWGKYDPSFETAEATAYLRDVPEAEVHILNAGHFALDEAVDDIALLMRRFLMRLGLDAR
ncbi:MAG: alpha/beta hydrolase [Caulobacteraceae bacterium]|nr:alpha/beta hydrolase [Caulobacter sp.]